MPNASYITNTFDGNARLKGTWLKNSSHTTLNHAVYGYNVGNQRTALTNGSTIGLWTKLEYDPIGQLKVADSYSASEDRGYTYDTAWNLNYRTNNGTLQTFTVDGLNQLTNAIGNTSKYDANGNLTNSAGVSYAYDDENQLALVSEDVNHAYRFGFVYDGQGRLRVRQQYQWLNAGPPWAPNYQWLATLEWRYVYDGMRVIQERASATPVYSYTRGTDLSGSLEGAGGIGGLLALSQNYQSGTGHWTNHHYYHADGNGNITYLVSTNQTLGASYRYDAYGNTLSSSGSQAGNNVYRFSSKECSSWLTSYGGPELYYYGYRWYVPSLQRWLARDPLGEKGFMSVTRKSSSIMRLVGEIFEDSNLYVFVNNAPVSKIDWFGLYSGGSWGGGYGVPGLPPSPNNIETASECGWRIMDEEKRRPANGKTDTWPHCVASCRISRECPGGRFSAWIGGGLDKRSLVAE